jgi:hypothetical protein
MNWERSLIPVRLIRLYGALSSVVHIVIGLGSPVGWRCRYHAGASLARSVTKWSPFAGPDFIPMNTKSRSLFIIGSFKRARTEACSNSGRAHIPLPVPIQPQCLENGTASLTKPLWKKVHFASGLETKKQAFWSSRIPELGHFLQVGSKWGERKKASCFRWPVSAESVSTAIQLRRLHSAGSPQSLEAAARCVF